MALALLMLLVGVNGGCSFRRLAIARVVPVIEDGMPAFEGERDLAFAREGLAANVKLLEALAVSSPHDQRLRLLLARAYGAYGLAFLQDETERWERDDPERSEVARRRARDFYLRCRDHGLAVLERRLPEVARALTTPTAEASPAEVLDRSLRGAARADVAALFWTAYGWGNYVNLSRDDLAAVAQAPLVERLMARVLELDEAYYLAGPHLFFAAWYASRPPLLGGKPDLARKHFDRADELNGRRFLLVPLYRARYLAVQVQDRELFEAELKRVVEAPGDILPAQNLATSLAKSKARWLLERADEWF